MPDFATIAAQFCQLRCAHCRAPFTPEAVTPLRQEADYWVVRVVCTGCGQPSGVAVVGADASGAAAGDASARPRELTKRLPTPFASPQEAQRFAALAPITLDDVLTASRRLRALGADWARHLPQR